MRRGLVLAVVFVERVSLDGLESSLVLDVYIRRFYLTGERTHDIQAVLVS